MSSKSGRTSYDYQSWFNLHQYRITATVVGARARWQVRLAGLDQVIATGFAPDIEAANNAATDAAWADSTDRD